MKKLKFIKRQDSGFKLSYGNSGETSLNLSNEIFDFISPEALSPGEERNVTFRIYKEDCIKALSFVIMKLPLYKSSSNNSNKVDNYLDVFGELYSKIENFFGAKNDTEYNVNLFYRPDGRIYLKGLRVNGFSIRDFLVENFSALQFDDEEGDLINLHILSDIEDNEELLNDETLQEELLRQLSAATFLRKALKIVDADDPNLSKLEALNKYKETNKQLKINGFNLWRKKDELPLRLEDVYQDLEILYNNQMYVMYLEWTPADMERLFFPVFNIAYDGLFKMGKDGDEYVLYKLNQSRKTGESPLQQIFYGAPGTGKSDTIYETTKDLPQENVYRTTFHPDSDYSTFVGCYKPIMKRQYRYDGKVKAKYYEDDDLAEAKKDDVIIDKVIQYNFIPQAFTNAYIKAWQTEEPVYLIIEEINRGNCAQIFGDLFQLLDRDENGYSKYPIDADTDLKNFLAEKFAETCRDDIKKEIKEGYKLRLPNNLYIWATMNTSDQSLFPIDSAFKRRWDWKYIKIKKGIDKKTKEELDWKIKVGEDRYDWWEFLKAINYKIDKMTSSADKQLGYFFCLADGKGNISADTFVNKVAFYLWNDVFKDYAEDGSPLLKYKKKEDDKSESDLTFPDFFDESGNVDPNVVRQFIEKVMADDKTDIKEE